MIYKASPLRKTPNQKQLNANSIIPSLAWHSIVQLCSTFFLHGFVDATVQILFRIIRDSRFARLQFLFLSPTLLSSNVVLFLASSLYSNHLPSTKHRKWWHFTLSSVFPVFFFAPRGFALPLAHTLSTYAAGQKLNVQQISQQNTSLILILLCFLNCLSYDFRDSFLLRRVWKENNSAKSTKWKWKK